MSNEISMSEKKTCFILQRIYNPV